MEIVALSADTWDLFEALGTKHNGVWGGCWCTWFTPDCAEKKQTAEGNRLLKKRLVEEGRNHAALVVQDGQAIGWAEYGPLAELPNIKHRKQVEAEQDQPPDWRITCFFTDRDHRRSGVAEAALQGALDLIADAGGGLVESYPMDTGGEKMNSSFLHNVTRSMFEDAGFTVVRNIGPKNDKCLMVKRVKAAAG